jgi:predicted alpha/beta-hydrolase family hydrolase
MPQSAEAFVDTTPGEASVRGFLHLGANRTGNSLVLTHGAGGNCNAPLLVALGEAFSEAGVNLLRCDLPYRQLRPHGPPSPSSAARDQNGLRRAVALIRQRFGGRVFLGGHSYGGRQASMLAASDATVSEGLLLMSYPLHPPGRHAQMRTAHFPNLRTPVLFVSGTRDDFATPDELKAAIALIAAPTSLLHVEGGGHSLLTKTNRSTLPATIITAWQSFFQQRSAAGDAS